MLHDVCNPLKLNEGHSYGTPCTLHQPVLWVCLVFRGKSVYAGNHIPEWAERCPRRWCRGKERRAEARTVSATTSSLTHQCSAISCTGCMTLGNLHPFNVISYVSSDMWREPCVHLEILTGRLGRDLDNCSVNPYPINHLAQHI